MFKMKHIPWSRHPWLHNRLRKKWITITTAVVIFMVYVVVVVIVIVIANGINVVIVSVIINSVIVIVVIVIVIVIAVVIVPIKFASWITDTQSKLPGKSQISSSSYHTTEKKF